ncbi:MAG: hypothetical protein H6Q68_397 [Firmicutes bacterium]|nr:hypothetical protein [Bacillota bacterium]
MDNDKIPFRRWFLILPATFLTYSINIMDRNNLGFGFAGMQQDLGIGATYAGLAGGIFAIGYLFLQVPGALWAERWSAKKLITIALVLWGLFATLTGFIQNLTQLLIIRFMVGFVEGCVLPPIVLLLKRWFPLKERARANSIWMLSVPFAALIMSPICGYLLTVANWRTMFIIEGMVPFIWAIIWWCLVDDYPSQSRWLSQKEKDYISASTIADEKQIQQQAVSVKEAIKNRNVIILIAVWFFMQIGFSGFSLWLPTMVKEFTGANNLSVGFISSLPWLAATIGIIVNSRHSDKTGERKLHVVIPAIISAIFLFASTLAGNSNPTLAICFLIACGGFIQSFYGIWWSIPAHFLTAEVLAVTLGLVNAIGNLGGFFGPFIFGFLKAQTNSSVAGMLFLVASSVVAALLLLMLRYKHPETAMADKKISKSISS